MCDCENILSLQQLGAPIKRPEIGVDILNKSSLQFLPSIIVNRGDPRLTMRPYSLPLPLFV